MLEIPTLETERLILRPWKPESDADAVFSYASLPEATRYMLFDTHLSVHDAAEFLSRAAGRPEHGYAITLKGDDRPIGGCGINPMFEHLKGEVGYILHPSHWGKGYATEATRGLIRYGFESLKLNKVYARADVRNPASVRVMEKAGMTREGILRDEMIVRGVACSFVYCSILLREWYAREAAPREG
jgi:ribosomal-protein-alanine N-acetyltransferase